jgi:hypothetical protein
MHRDHEDDGGGVSLADGFESNVVRRRRLIDGDNFLG